MLVIALLVFLSFALNAAPFPLSGLPWLFHRGNSCEKLASQRLFEVHLFFLLDHPLPFRPNSCHLPGTYFTSPTPLSELVHSFHPLLSPFLPQSWFLLSFTYAHTPSLPPLASSCSNNYVLSYVIFRSVSSHTFLLSLKHGKVFLTLSTFSSASLLPQSVISQCTPCWFSYFTLTS